MIIYFIQLPVLLTFQLLRMQIPRAGVGSTRSLTFTIFYLALGVALYIRLHVWRLQVRALGWDVTIRHLLFNPLCVQLALVDRKLIRKEEYLLLPVDQYQMDPKNEIEMIQRAFEATHRTETSDGGVAAKRKKLIAGIIIGLFLLGALSYVFHDLYQFLQSRRI